MVKYTPRNSEIDSHGWNGRTSSPKMSDRPEFAPRSFPSHDVGPVRTPNDGGQRVVLLTVLVAIGLFVLLLIFMPRATFRIENVEYIITPCDPTSQSHQVTASMTIRNTGTASGVTGVRLFIDGRPAATGYYEIAPHESVHRGLRQVITDCQSHRFAVELFTPIESG